jgi:hypothetical protein
MEISKITFKGTSEEFPSVAHLFATLGSEADPAAHPADGSLEQPNGANDELVRRVLNRMEIPPGQIALYKALANAGEERLSASALAAAMGRTEQVLSGVLGALGRRINGTEGVDQTNPPGIGLFLGYTRENGKWHYRLRPEVRDALERKGVI